MHSKFLLTLTTLVASCLAKSVTNCGNCKEGTSSDCYAAFALIPTSGTVSGNDNTLWTSGTCTFSFFPNGVAGDAATIHGYAQTLINSCCAGSSDCSGIGYSENGVDGLEDGTLCMAKTGQNLCTPRIYCGL